MSKDKKEIRVTLRLPPELNEKIVKMLEWRIGKISKNQWIIETLTKYLISNNYDIQKN